MEDPVSVSGLIMAGLTFPAQMFSSGVIAYTTLSQVLNIESSFRKYYWHFKVQESRYIFWGMCHKACSPGGLDPNKMPEIIYKTIVQALTQINTLLEDKDNLCTRYGLQEIGEIQPADVSLIRRETMRQQNMVKCLQRSSTLLRKVQWAVMDQGRFAELVQQLTELINTLYEMLPVPGGPLVEDTIAAQALADALINGGGLRNVEGLQGTTDPQLQGLQQMHRAMYSALSREEIENSTELVRPASSLYLLLNVEQLEFPDQNSIPNPVPHLRSWARPRQNDLVCGQDFLVVEWRRYDPQRGRENLKMALQVRIEALAKMLKEKPRSDSFRVLDCIGYFEDNSDTRFGLTFRLPNDYNQQQDPVPMSLFEAITSYPNDIPCLGDRFRLAYLLAESVHALHATGWLHKSICSHNILLFRKNSRPAQRTPQRPVSLENPYFTGFGFSRPGGPAEESSRSAAAHEMAIYRHPDVQGFGGRPIASYRAIYDIYSLGTILLEIGTWRSLSKIYPRSAAPDLDFRRLLLDRFVSGLGPSMGERYMIAVRKCLDGSFERLEEFSENEYDSADYKDNVREGLLWEVVTMLRDCRA